MTLGVEFVSLDWRGQTVDIEVQWVGVPDAHAPCMVFLHEGLGSVAMWRDFPDRLCQATGMRGLVYSRPGYGQSTVRAEEVQWQPDFMHRQALEVLPALLSAVELDVDKQPPWFFGHSDGGSIALIYAAHHPAKLAGAIVLAPHIYVEDVAIASIQKARTAYLETDLRERMKRFHADPDSAFWGWNNAWLSPGFRPWHIDDQLDSIRCSLLAVQGTDDEYGTLEQIHGIARKVPQCELLELTDCKHSPHKDQPEKLISAVSLFIQRQQQP